LIGKGTDGRAGSVASYRVVVTMTDLATAEIHVLVDVPITFETLDGTTVHSPMVAATVGGVPTRLILDTGSTDHVVTKELIDRIAVRVEAGEDGTDHAGAAVPSWSVGELEVRIGQQPFALHNVVAIAGEIMTMPGLPKVPSAENIYLDENGEIEGLF